MGKGHCRWCGRIDDGDAGDYYHEKDCHRRDVLRRMESAEKAKRDNDALLAKRLAKLERELAEASYTGD